MYGTYLFDKQQKSKYQTEQLSLKIQLQTSHRTHQLDYTIITWAWDCNLAWVTCFSLYNMPYEILKVLSYLKNKQFNLVPLIRMILQAKK